MTYVCAADGRKVCGSEAAGVGLRARRGAVLLLLIVLFQCIMGASGRRPEPEPQFNSKQWMRKVSEFADQFSQYADKMADQAARGADKVADWFTELKDEGKEALCKKCTQSSATKQQLQLESCQRRVMLLEDKVEYYSDPNKVNAQGILSDLRKEVADLKEKNDRLKVTCSSNPYKSDTQGTLDDLRAQIAELQEQNERIKAELRHEQKLCNTQSKFRDIVEENKDLKRENESLRKKVKNSMTETSWQQNWNAPWDADPVNGMDRKLKKEIKSLVSENKILVHQVEEAEDRALELQKELSKAHKQLSKLKKRVKQAGAWSKETDPEADWRCESCMSAPPVSYEQCQATYGNVWEAQNQEDVKLDANRNCTTIADESRRTLSSCETHKVEKYQFLGGIFLVHLLFVGPTILRILYTFCEWLMLETPTRPISHKDAEPRLPTVEQGSSEDNSEKWELNEMLNELEEEEESVLDSKAAESLEGNSGVASWQSDEGPNEQNFDAHWAQCQATSRSVEQESNLSVEMPAESLAVESHFEGGDHEAEQHARLAISDIRNALDRLFPPEEEARDLDWEVIN